MKVMKNETFNRFFNALVPSLIEPILWFWKSGSQSFDWLWMKGSQQFHLLWMKDLQPFYWLWKYGSNLIAFVCNCHLPIIVICMPLVVNGGKISRKTVNLERINSVKAWKRCHSQLWNWKWSQKWLGWLKFEAPTYLCEWRVVEVSNV